MFFFSFFVEFYIFSSENLKLFLSQNRIRFLITIITLQHWSKIFITRFWHAPRIRVALHSLGHTQRVCPKFMDQQSYHTIHNIGRPIARRRGINHHFAGSYILGSNVCAQQNKAHTRSYAKHMLCSRAHKYIIPTRRTYAHVYVLSCSRAAYSPTWNACMRE